jgi:Uncharacterized enzyme of heme biosynthesis
MYTPLLSTPLPSRVLLLSGQDSSVRTDVATLHSLGVTALMHHTGEKEALKALAESAFPATDEARSTAQYTIDMLVCEEQFAGRALPFFLRKLSTHSHYGRIPVLVLTRSNQAAEMLKVCGVTALSRPYTQKDLSDAIAKALSPMRRPLSSLRLEAVCRRLEAEKKTAGKKSGSPEARTLLQEGLQALASGQRGKAEVLFLESLKVQPDLVEASLNLARLAHQRGDREGTNACLLRAADSCRRRGLVEQEETIRSMLPPDMKTKDIVLQEAAALLTAGNYGRAARNLLEHCSNSSDQKLYAVVARACQMTPFPQESIDKICRTLEKMGQGETAGNLRNRLLGRGEELPPLDREWTESFSRFREWLNIASYTAWAWRQT